MRTIKQILAMACALTAMGSLPSVAGATTGFSAYNFSPGEYSVSVFGDAAADNITVAYSAPNLTFTASGGLFAPSFSGQLCSGTATTITCNVPGNVAISGPLGDGNDTLNGTSLPSTVTIGDGGVGVSGEGGNDTITGGAGDDTLVGDYQYTTGTTGIDTLVGGNGEDALYLKDGITDNPLSDCGGGTDIVEKDATDVVSGCEASPLQFTQQVTISGTPGVGNLLSTSLPAYTGGPANHVDYYWFVCTDVAQNVCSDDAVSTTTTYRPVAADGGRYLFVSVYASPTASYPGSDYSESSPVLIPRLPSAPSNVFSLGSFSGKAAKGTLSITVPGPGTLTAGPVPSASGAKKKKKKKAKALIGKSSVVATAAGVVKLPVKLSSAGKKQLKKKKVKAKVLVSFTPTGGATATKVATVTFKKKKKKK